MLIADKTFRMVGIFVLTGVIMRVLLMPIAAHSDLLNASYRESLAAYNNLIRTSDFNEIILSFYIRVMKPFLDGLMPALNHPTPEGILGTDAYNIFASSAKVFRYLFILKIPFLLLDLAALYFLLKFFKESSNKILVSALWAFNPFVLYGVYMWGRYEVFAILFLIISLFWAKQGRATLAFLSLGFAIAFRVPLALYLPFFLIYFSKNWKEAAKYSVITFAAPILAMKGIQLIGGTNIISELGQLGFLNYFLSARITGGFVSISINFILYPIILYLFYKNRASFENFISFGTIGILSVMALSYVHPHYYAWTTPFLILAAVYNKKIILPAIILALVFFQLAEASFGESISFGLFLPLNPSVFSNVGSLFRSFQMAQLDFNIILNSILVLSTLTISFLLYNSRTQNEDK